jgi:septum formation inhibitor MinC
MAEENFILVIDGDGDYSDSDNIFHLLPDRLPLSRCLADNTFEQCIIKNSPTENLTALHLSYVLRKIKPKSLCDIFVFQPISVMQEFDCKQIEANAKLAGFTDFQARMVEIKDGEKSYRTTRIRCVRPESKREQEKEKEKEKEAEQPKKVETTKAKKAVVK